MARFIQFTDTHITPQAVLAYGKSDTAAALEIAVESANRLVTRVGPVDFAIVTGDLTDFGTAPEYERFKVIMSRLALPYRVIPGNHDRRAALRGAFADQDWMPKSGPVQWQIDTQDFTLIALDTLVEGEHYGLLSAGGLEYLEAGLAAAAGRPVIVATHHPFFHTGIRPMDVNNLRNGQELLSRLQDYSGDVRMISGHVHRAMTAQIGKVTCQIAPATCHAVHVDQRVDAINSLIMEPGAVTLYETRSEPLPTLVSNIVPVGNFAGPWPFYGPQPATGARSGARRLRLGDAGGR
jgi:3',5'-cyclic-AMP phosphodiesterase